MKQKYILGVYDKLIHEINYNKEIKVSDIISYLKNCSVESHYLYQIKFSKKNGEIEYYYQKRIHNLHPYAPSFIKSDCFKGPEFENLIPRILHDLNISGDNLDFCWTLQNDKNILIIKEPCRLEDIAPENLLFLYCFQLVKNENHLIKSSLNETFFSLKSEGKIELFIHRKQYALEKLSKSLIGIIKPDNPHDIYSFSSNYDKIDCLKIIHVHLEKLLIFIEQEYRNYLNVNIQVPYRTVLVKELEIVEKLNYVKSRFLDCIIDNRLLKLAYEPLLKIETIDIQEKITYNEFNYCCSFISELCKQFQKYPEDVTESIIKDWLFDLNLNSLEFFNYATDEILKKLKLSETDTEKIDALYQILKSFNQRQSPFSIKFNKKLPNIKQQVVGWMEEELEYLSKKKSLVIGDSPNHANHSQRVKIQTSLSVGQLTYFIKLLMIVKVITHKNQSEVFRFIADNFITKATTAISVDSVKSKFYNVEIGSMKTIRLIIIELMNQTK